MATSVPFWVAFIAAMFSVPVAAYLGVMGWQKAGVFGEDPLLAWSGVFIFVTNAILALTIPMLHTWRTKPNSRQADAS